MFVVVRAITYAVLFIGLLLVYVPAQLLRGSRFVRPEVFGLPQICGMITPERNRRADSADTFSLLLSLEKERRHRSIHRDDW